LIPSNFKNAATVIISHESRFTNPFQSAQFPQSKNPSPAWLSPDSRWPCGRNWVYLYPVDSRPSLCLRSSFSPWSWEQSKFFAKKLNFNHFLPGKKTSLLQTSLFFLGVQFSQTWRHVPETDVQKLRLQQINCITWYFFQNYIKVIPHP